MPASLQFLLPLLLAEATGFLLPNLMVTVVLTLVLLMTLVLPAALIQLWGCMTLTDCQAGLMVKTRSHLGDLRVL